MMGSLDVHTSTSTSPMDQSAAEEAANNMHEMQQDREGLQAPAHIHTSLSEGGRGRTERERVGTVAGVFTWLTDGRTDTLKLPAVGQQMGTSCVCQEVALAWSHDQVCDCVMSNMRDLPISKQYTTMLTADARLKAKTQQACGDLIRTITRENKTRKK